VRVQVTDLYPPQYVEMNMNFNQHCKVIQVFFDFRDVSCIIAEYFSG